MKSSKAKTNMLKTTAAFVILAILSVFAPHAGAQDGDEKLKAMKARTNLALVKVFQKLESDQIKDGNPKERKRERRDSVGRYKSNPDYRQAQLWIAEFDEAGQLAVRAKRKHPSVSEIVADMKRYRFRSSECSKVYVYQILHAYNQQLDLYFEKDDGKIAAIARLLARIHGEFTDVGSGDHKHFLRYSTKEDEGWRRMIENAGDYNKQFCKSE